MNNKEIKCEICNSNYKVSFYKKYRLFVCNKHRIQLYINGQIKEEKIPLNKQPCVICNEIKKSMNSKNGISYCSRHYMQLHLHDKILPDINNIELLNNHAEIILWNNRVDQIEVGKAFIDLNDIDKVKNRYWTLSAENYAVDNSNKTFLHNLILNINTNNHLKLVPDHINRNRLDNRKINLRIVSRLVNACNKGIMSNNTSGYPGVSFMQKLNKYRAYIKISQKQISLGHYDNLEDAIKARQAGELKYFGEIINRDYDINTIYKKDE